MLNIFMFQVPGVLFVLSYLSLQQILTLLFQCFMVPLSVHHPAKKYVTLPNPQRKENNNKF